MKEAFAAIGVAGLSMIMTQTAINSLMIHPERFKMMEKRVTFLEGENLQLRKEMNSCKNFRNFEYAWKKF